MFATLLYGLEMSSSSRKAYFRSLDFATDRLFMKLFRANSMDTVRQCQQFLNFKLPSVTVTHRAATFSRYSM